MSLMPRALWPLRHGSPSVRVILSPTAGGRQVPRYLLADTGAGTARSGFDLLLEDSDCLHCGGSLVQLVHLSGAYSGFYPLYDLPVQVPELGFNRGLRAVGIPTRLAGFDGVAAFQFLNRFTYGNFGNPGQFGLET
jgi:hypothetical protein